MKNKFVAVVVWIGLALPVMAANLVEEAVSPDTNVADAAIAALRAEGPPGLQALVDANASLLQNHPVITPEWKRLENALNKIAAQQDASASRLYWYTDFEHASAAAKASGKPILSLRLLGNLDEEYSCANSRFFRTTLYANAEVSQYLRDHFILHWQSERPAPRITVDFGDGRKIERTVTGNSIHYIVDSEGCVIDALPGLYGAKAFLKSLAEANDAARQASSQTGPAKEQYLSAYHRARREKIMADWKRDLTKIGQPAETSFQEANDTTWKKLATLHANESRVDESVKKLILAKTPTAFDAGRIAVSKSVVENPLVAQLRNLEQSIAEDTVRNEYLLHSQIHLWLESGDSYRQLGQFNSRVYANLFLTPESDPWLGLAPVNTFSALPNNGLVINNH